MNPRIQSILSSRFVVVPFVLATVIVAWNLYVSAHNDGVVRGRVVDAMGRPVAGAAVTLMEQNFTTNTPRAKAMTDAEGRFEFTDNRSHSIQLRAEKASLGESTQQAVRLYFRAQNVELAAPLEIRDRAPGG